MLESGRSHKGRSLVICVEMRVKGSVHVRNFLADTIANGDRPRATSEMGPHNKARKQISEIDDQKSSVLKIPRRLSFLSKCH